MTQPVPVLNCLKIKLQKNTGETGSWHPTSEFTPAHLVPLSQEPVACDSCNTYHRNQSVDGPVRPVAEKADSRAPGRRQIFSCQRSFDRRSSTETVLAGVPVPVNFYHGPLPDNMQVADSTEQDSCDRQFRVRQKPARPGCCRARRRQRRWPRTAYRSCPGK
jgi:hypothetical protein